MSVCEYLSIFSWLIVELLICKGGDIDSVNMCDCEYFNLFILCIHV